ncbi:hypothetical protein [Novosphingobium sp. 9U]|uniref:hypothetical protein n=1 Tax=Novosphingobium sp. 9U TaxID=2653158 RepID=UPI001F26B7CE|nr:hypothetical protein [Novosphingobium sp. 9U]
MNGRSSCGAVPSSMPCLAPIYRAGARKTPSNPRSLPTFARRSRSVDLGGDRLMLSGNVYYTSSFYFDLEQQFR